MTSKSAGALHVSRLLVCFTGYCCEPQYRDGIKRHLSVHSNSEYIIFYNNYHKQHGDASLHVENELNFKTNNIADYKLVSSTCYVCLDPDIWSGGAMQDSRRLDQWCCHGASAAENVSCFC